MLRLRRDMAIGRTHWAIAEGWIPDYSHGPEPEMLSHETACILNAGDADAHVEITIYFKDREPAGPHRATAPPRAPLTRRRAPARPGPRPGPAGAHAARPLHRPRRSGADPEGPRLRQRHRC